MKNPIRTTMTIVLLALMTSPASLVMYAAALVGLLVSQRPWRWRRAIR